MRAGEGVGLEPGDVDDRPVRVEWLEPGQAPLGAKVGRPAPWSRDVVVLLPGPALVGPPFPSLVTTPLPRTSDSVALVIGVRPIR